MSPSRGSWTGGSNGRRDYGREQQQQTREYYSNSNERSTTGDQGYIDYRSPAPLSDFGFDYTHGYAPGNRAYNNSNMATNDESVYVSGYENPYPASAEQYQYYGAWYGSQSQGQYTTNSGYDYYAPYDPVRESESRLEHVESSVYSNTSNYRDYPLPYSSYSNYRATTRDEPATGSRYYDERYYEGRSSSYYNERNSSQSLSKRELDIKKHTDKSRWRSRINPSIGEGPTRRGSPVYHDYEGMPNSRPQQQHQSSSNNAHKNYQSKKQPHQPYSNYNKDKNEGQNYGTYSSYNGKSASHSPSHPHSNFQSSRQYHSSAPSSAPFLAPPVFSASSLLSSPPASVEPHLNAQEVQQRPPPSPTRTSKPSRPSSPVYPPRSTTPTKEYLQTAENPSWTLSDDQISKSRKLIVLDLNGSLLVRSARQKRAYVPSPQTQPNSTAGYNKPLQVRTVHPRPYLSCFVEYILHKENRKWLDTMVWSSAQPHSVNDMVDKCFGNRKEELIAVWARDTLGLSGDEYHRKTQTYKDLAKPWAELPVLPSSHPHPSTSTSSDSQPKSHPFDSSMSPDSFPPFTVPAEPTTSSSSKGKQQQVYSALTTLLIDDSRLKAALQPFNHLCIPEYVQAMRNRDLVVAEKEWKRLNEGEGVGISEETSEKEKRRVEKKMKRSEARRAAAADGGGGSWPEKTVEGKSIGSSNDGERMEEQAVEEQLLVEPEREQEQEQEEGVIPLPVHVSSSSQVQSQASRHIQAYTQASSMESSAPAQPESATEQSSDALFGGPKRVIRELAILDGQLVNHEPEVLKRVTREVVIMNGEMVDPLAGPPTLVEREVAVGSMDFLGSGGTMPPPSEYTTAALAMAAAASEAREGNRQSAAHRRRRVKRAEKREKEKREMEAMGAMISEVPLDPDVSVPEPKGENVLTSVNDPLLQEVDNIKVEDISIEPEQPPSPNEKVKVEQELTLETEPEYDPTLLAVIGILEHIKYEGNVAGWMKRGGLIAHVKQYRQGIILGGESETMEVVPGIHGQGAVGEPKRARPHTPPTNGPQKRRRIDVPEPAPTDVLPSAAPTPDLACEGGIEETETKMWFECPEILAFWAERGREALKKLGVDIVSGLERP